MINNIYRGQSSIVTEILGTLFMGDVDSLNPAEARSALKKLHSKLSKFTKEKSKEAKAWTCLGMALVIRGQRDYWEACRILDQAKAIFLDENNEYGLACTYYELAYSNRELDRNTLALDYVHQAASLFEKLNCKVELAWVYDNYSVIHLNLFNRSESLAYAKKARSYFVETDAQSGMAWNACNLAGLYSAMGFNEQSKRYYSEAFRIFKKLKSEQGMGWSLIGLGTVARSVCQFEDALKAFDAAKVIYKKLDHKDRIGWCLVQKAAISRLRGHYRKALSLNKEALKYFSPIRNNDGVGWCCFQLGQVYRDQGELLKSWQSFKEALNLHLDIANRKGIGWDQNDMGRTYVLMGDLDHARECFIKAKVIADQLDEIPLKLEVLKNFSILHFEEGHLNRSRESLAQCDLLIIKMNADNLEVDFKLQLARFAIVKGENREAMFIVQEAKRIVKETGLLCYATTLNLFESELLFSMGKGDRAYACLKKNKPPSRGDGYSLDYIATQLGSIQYYLRRGTVAKASLIANRVSKNTRLLNSRKFKAKILGVKALIGKVSKKQIDFKGISQSLYVAQSTGLVLIERELRLLAKFLVVGSAPKVEIQKLEEDNRQFIMRAPRDIYEISNTSRGSVDLPISLVI